MLQDVQVTERGGGPGREVSSAAFDRLYDELYESVARLALGLTGSREVAEEVAQEAFLAAFTNWDRVRTLDAPAAWVKRVAVNRSRSLRRRVSTELRWRSSQSVAAGAVSHELSGHDEPVWKALRGLPRRQLEAVVLMILEGYSAAETAQILGCEPPTVRTHLRRALASLQDKLGPEEGSS